MEFEPRAVGNHREGPYTIPVGGHITYFRSWVARPVDVYNVSPRQSGAMVETWADRG